MAPDGAWPRAIIHLDLDAFYASVEQLRRPELRGRPVIVGGAADRNGRVITNRGVVSAASYEARVFGVHSAMPLATALRLCPQAAVVPVDFAAYRDKSAQVFAIARVVTPLVEPMSLDEAYLDVSGSRLRFGEPPAIAARLRDEILAATELHCSFGVATTKVIAKVASDLRKPRGLVVVPPGEEAAFLAPLPVRRLPGLGPAAERALQGLGITTLGQLAGLPIEVVQRRLGEHAGASLWSRAQGIDEGEVTVPGRPKSVSREETFFRDVSDRAALTERMRHLAADVGRRLRHGEWRGRTITLKLRYSDFTTLSRQVSLPTPTDADLLIARTGMDLLEACWTGDPVRLLGVGVSSLEDASQLDLFEAPADHRDERLDRVLDQLRTRFGDTAVRRGATAPSLRDSDWRGDDLRRLGGSDESPADR
ncbi:MAG TPA: DNA polymerase IV [Candidatus Angelobacter sp.]|jgi:DNA polymerase-4|nr:DNA polymerase IV [Candidatus Angelobacter sp.]